MCRVIDLVRGKRPIFCPVAKGFEADACWDQGADHTDKALPFRIGTHTEVSSSSWRHSLMVKVISG